MAKDDAEEFDPTKVDVLLFDLGGVVIGLDFQRVFRRWAEQAKCEVAQIEDTFTMDDAYERHERGELDASGYFASLRASLGIALTDEEFLLGWNDIYPGPIEGMDELLRAASQRFPLYAFTNSNPSHADVWSARFRRELAHFRSVVVSSDLGLRKPEVEAFQSVARRIGVLPSRFLFFDDSVANVNGAREAGMQAVRVQTIDDVRRSLAQFGVSVD